MSRESILKRKVYRLSFSKNVEIKITPEKNTSLTKQSGFKGCPLLKLTVQRVQQSAKVEVSLEKKNKTMFTTCKTLAKKKHEIN